MTNTTEAQTLTSWLLDRIADDEAVALAASPGPWSAEDYEVLAVDGITVCDGFALSGPQTRATTDHIARHDPARVLAECESKRWIVSNHGGRHVCQDALVGARRDGDLEDIVDDPCDDLRHLAAVYADAPGYDAAWAVS